MRTDILDRAQRDIDSGKAYEARDRLHEEIKAHPELLELRTALGNVYAALGDTVRAGLFWYFVKDKTPTMLDACGDFERACRNRPVAIAKRLTYEGDIDAVQCARARRVLRLFKHKRRKHRDWVRAVAYGYGCLVAFVIVLGGLGIVLLVWLARSLPR